MDKNVIVGIEHGDDAAVYRLPSGEQLVATLDFFTPVVDDARDFGRIAAANSLSDVYAMGGRPLFALSIVCWPVQLGMEQLGEVMAGGSAVAAAAGIPILGGHSVDDTVPKYGLVAIGLVEPGKLTANKGAVPGDRLYLTKPLGSGALTGAIKKGLLDDAGVREVTDVMATLNDKAARAMNAAGVKAATDVTGFGLLGHLQKMMLASGTEAHVRVRDLPVIEAARALYSSGAVPGGTKRNLSHFGASAVFEAGVPAGSDLLAADAQTSGGILACVPAAGVAAFEASLRESGTLVACIGEVRAGIAGRCVFA